MSNERIDLTQEVLREKLYDWMTEGYEPQMAIPDDLPNEITEILYCIEHLGLLAELKRCYEEIDYLNALTNNLPIEMLVEAENNLQASE